MRIDHKNKFAGLLVATNRLMKPADVYSNFERELHAALIRDGIGPIAIAIIELLCDHNRMQKTLADLSSAAATMATASELVHDVIESRTHRAHLPAGVIEDKEILN
jgi:hypothetical protein